MKVLLIEDDGVQASAVKLATELLDSEAVIVHQPNGTGAAEAIVSQRPDIVLLDLGLPGVDGITVLQDIRQSSAVPVIIVSGRNNPSTIARALQLGADDYVTKPFYAIELLARINAVLRRSPATRGMEQLFSSAGVAIDFGSKRLEVQGERAELSRIEWRILDCLWKSSGGVIDRAVLRGQVWSGEAISDTGISMAVSRLRQKLGEAA